MGKPAIDDRRQLTKDLNKLLDQNLAPGEVIRCRYRVWIHRGSTDVERATRAYRAFTNAPAFAFPR